MGIHGGKLQIHAWRLALILWWYYSWIRSTNHFLMMRRVNNNNNNNKAVGYTGAVVGCTLVQLHDLPSLANKRHQQKDWNNIRYSFYQVCDSGRHTLAARPTQTKTIILPISPSIFNPQIQCMLTFGFGVSWLGQFAFWKTKKRKGGPGGKMNERKDFYAAHSRHQGIYVPPQWAGG